MMVPIKIGSQTLVGPDRDIPHKFGNCFSLIDEKGESHAVVNFLIENLEECQKLFKLTDINVELLPKSNTIWLITDTRIPEKWYCKKYCTVCTPIRMLPFEQRKEYLKNHTFKKSNGFLLIKQNIEPQPAYILANYKVIYKGNL